MSNATPELLPDDLFKGLEVYAFDTKGKYWSLSLPISKRDEQIGHSMNTKLAELKDGLEKLRAPAPDTRLREVAMELDHFQKEYFRNTGGCDMPGNDFYSRELMRIVLKARAALAAIEGEETP